MLEEALIFEIGTTETCGVDLPVPFTPGRTDASQEQTDVESFAVLEPTADGFRNYLAPGQALPAENLLLEKARAPGTDVERKAAYSALQKGMAAGDYLLPLTFADEVVVARDTLQGPVVRQVTDPSDRFWDVLTWRLAVDR